MCWTSLWDLMRAPARDSSSNCWGPASSSSRKGTQKQLRIPLTLTIYSPSPLDPVTKDILSKAKELSNVKTRIRLTSCLDTARKSPNLLTLGRHPHLSGLPTLTSAQIKSKPDSLTSLVRAMKMCRSQSGNSWPLLTLDPHPKSKETTNPATPTLKILDSRTQTIQWLASSRGSRTSTELVLDIETHGDNDLLHPAERPLACVGLYDGNQAAIIPAHLLTGSWPGLIEALQGFDLIAHNGKFDLVTLCSQLGDTRISLKLTWDTMLMHYVLWPASQQGLKPVAKQVLGVDDWETFEAFERLSRHVYPQREQWYEKAYPALLRAAELGGKKMDMTRVGDYHPTMVHLYNAYDVYYTHLMWGYLHPILNMNIDATQAYNHLIRFSNWIQVDEADGFPVDLRKTGQLRAPYATQVDQHRRELIRWAHQYVPSEEFPKGEFNPNSWQQVMKLYSRVGRTLSSTDEKTMGK